MATLLSQVKKGKIKKPHLVLIYGPDSAGKSTFGAQAPSPVFLGTEDGTNNLDVSRFPAPKSWQDIWAAINELTNDKHDYKTLVIDSLDWLEPMLHQAICDRHGAKSIELAAGGYGKGYVEAVTEWQKLCKSLSTLRDTKGMNIILIAHSEIVKFTDPSMQSEYDRYQIKIYKKSAALFREFVDSVLFANFEIFTKKEGGKTRAHGDGARVLYTERRPGFDAKNRFGIPFQIPLSWEEYEKAVEAGDPQDPRKIRESIMQMLTEVKDEALKVKVVDTVEKAGDNALTLEAIRNKLAIRLGEQG